MRVAGESENYGTEQEHLNNVHGVRLRITALRAISGPGVELLEYIAPRDGRAYPQDLRANDLTHWETIFRTGDPAQSWTALRKAHTEFVSSEAEDTVDGADRATGFLVKDPDGHVIGLLSLQPESAAIISTK